MLNPEVAARIDAGLLLAGATIRDRAGNCARDGGRTGDGRDASAGPSFRSAERSTTRLLRSITRWKTSGRWSALAKLELFLYNEICFDTLAVATRLARQIGVAADPGKVLAPFRTRGLIGQFNKGAALRYQEMPAEQQTAFLDRYAELYRAFRFDTPAAEAVARAQELLPLADFVVICAGSQLTFGACCRS